MAKLLEFTIPGDVPPDFDAQLARSEEMAAAMEDAYNEWAWRQYEDRAEFVDGNS